MMYQSERGERGLDQALIEKVKNGNDHAFRILIEKYRDYIFRTVYGVLRNQKDAEDAAQEVFLKIYTSLPQYEHQGFKTWITRIAVNHAIDCQRKNQRRKEDTVEDILLVPPQDDHHSRNDSIEKQVLLKEKRMLVRKRLDEVPDNYREVIYGYYIAEKSYQQLAKEQNVQVKTIETKLYRARLWMKKHWKEDDFS
jgi:RNA polymerase sigma factor (sigma-70 family)